MENNICKYNEVISGDLICADFVYEKTAIQSIDCFTDKYILALVTAGHGELVINGTSFKVEAGDAFFVDKNCHFSITGNDALAYIYISFYGRRADELTDRFSLSSSSCVFCLKEHSEKLSTFMFDCLKNASQQKADILSECGLLYLLSHLDSKKRETSDLLQKIIKLTNKYFTEPDFSLTTLSEELNYSSKYLSFFFKKNEGICFNEYLRSLRIKHSLFLMEQGITSIKNIALLSGFSDALYYSKLFKQEIGHSPKEHIEMLTKDQKNG